MELQELVARARLLFSGAPKRFNVFNLVNGKRSAKEIAKKSGKSLSATLQDLQKMRDLELVVPRKGEDERIIRKEKSIIYEKVPLLKHLSDSYFKDPTKLPVVEKKKPPKGRLKIKISKGIAIPREQEILNICNTGEDQLFEFKRAGTDVGTLSKEICAFANTRMGGLIFYGVEDDGAIGNADISKQTFDQKLRNSVRNTISPAISIEIIEKDVLGHRIFLIYTPPWNRKQVYQFDGRIYIRHGTNVFIAKPEELKKLYDGECVI